MSLDPIISSDGDVFFRGDDGCPSCGSLVLSDSHRAFIFYCSPEDIEYSETTVDHIPSEWRPGYFGPGTDPLNIPGDVWPGRVAMWHQNKAVVQVCEGEDAGTWVPCSSFTVTREGLPYSVWLCRRDIDGCDEDFLRGISS